MAHIRRLCLGVAAALALLFAQLCMAQSNDAASSVAADSAPIVLQQTVLNQLMGVQQDPQNAGQVALTREHLLRLLGAASDPLRNRMMFGLIVASFSFVALSIMIMMIVVVFVRWSFWKSAALAGPHKWRTYLLQLPLGAPEGSIRALLSLFVVVFGFLVIAMQRYLNLGNTEAIAGFVGAVITFYFTSRNSEQARKAVAQAHAAADTTAANTADVIQKATDSAATAQRETSERINTVAQTAIDNSRQTTAMALHAVTDTAAGTTVEPVAGADASGAKSRLETVRDRLNSIQQIARGVSSLGVGGETLPAAATTIATAADLLGKIEPLLRGKPDAVSVANVLNDAESRLPALEAAGLPGAMAESIEVLRNVASPILAGIPGGPIGIAGGVLLAGIRLADRQRDLNAFKAAVLSRPFDPVLLPDVPDAADAAAAYAISPLIQAHFPDDPQTRQVLLDLVTGKNADGTRRNAADIAQMCESDILNNTNNVLPERKPDAPIATVDELAHAFDEYLGSLVHLSALKALPGDVTLPPVPAPGGQVQIDLKTLADTARQLLPDPKAEAQIERLLYLAEALGKLPVDKDKAVGLVTDALGVIAQTALVQTRTEESE